MDWKGKKEGTERDLEPSSDLASAVSALEPFALVLLCNLDNCQQAFSCEHTLLPSITEPQ